MWVSIVGLRKPGWTGWCGEYLSTREIVESPPPCPAPVTFLLGVRVQFLDKGFRRHEGALGRARVRHGGTLEKGTLSRE
jgi:hypothetical protein